LDNKNEVLNMHELVKDYYGNQLKGTADLRTSAMLRRQPDAGLDESPCCHASTGCDGALLRLRPGLPTLDGLKVLDLGCGSARRVRWRSWSASTEKWSAST
jgi:hypothetical protein